MLKWGGASHALRALEARTVALYRENKLARLTCCVRDCMSCPEWPFEHSKADLGHRGRVINGTASCFKRRSTGAQTYAWMNASWLAQYERQRMQAHSIAFPGSTYSCNASTSMAVAHAIRQNLHLEPEVQQIIIIIIEFDYCPFLSARVRHRCHSHAPARDLYLVTRYFVVIVTLPAARCRNWGFRHTPPRATSVSPNGSTSPQGPPVSTRAWQHGSECFAGSGWPRTGRKL